MNDFYAWLKQIKKDNKLNNTYLGSLIGKKEAAFRMSINRQSLSILEQRELKNKIENELFSNKSEPITNKNGNRFEELPNGKYKIYVKKLPVNAFGSYLSDFQNVDFINELEEVSFTVDHIGRGKYMCFEVDGDSMNGGGIYDTPDGAELLVRELGRQHWKDGFRESKYGWVIVHKETVLFKDLKDLDFKTGEITCFSRSGLPQHGSFKINLNDVNQIFKVIKRTF